MLCAHLPPALLPCHVIFVQGKDEHGRPEPHRVRLSGGSSFVAEWVLLCNACMREKGQRPACEMARFDRFLFADLPLPSLSN